VHKNSVNEEFKNILTRAIVGGKYKIGDKLPPERELSQETGISRIIVHTVITEFSAKGLLKIVPRQGTFVSDYTREGSLELIELLMTEDGMEQRMFDSMFAARRMLEREFARLAAENRTEENLSALRRVIKEEEKTEGVEEISARDFAFHQEIAFATGNCVYPLMFKTLQKPYMLLERIFYNRNINRAAVLAAHRALVDAIERRDVRAADDIVSKMLIYGEINCREQSPKEVSRWEN